MKVVKKDGKYYSLDNRRLFVHKEVLKGKHAQVKKMFISFSFMMTPDFSPISFLLVSKDRKVKVVVMDLADPKIQADFDRKNTSKDHSGIHVKVSLSPRLVVYFFTIFYFYFRLFFFFFFFFFLPI